MSGTQGQKIASMPHCLALVLAAILQLLLVLATASAAAAQGHTVTVLQSQQLGRADGRLSGPLGARPQMLVADVRVSSMPDKIDNVLETVVGYQSSAAAAGEDSKQQDKEFKLVRSFDGPRAFQGPNHSGSKIVATAGALLHRQAVAPA